MPQAFAVSTLMLLILTSYFTGALSIVSAKRALWKLLTERTSPLSIGDGFALRKFMTSDVLSLLDP